MSFSLAYGLVLSRVWIAKSIIVITSWKCVGRNAQQYFDGCISSLAFILSICESSVCRHPQNEIVVRSTICKNCFANSYLLLDVQKYSALSFFNFSTVELINTFGCC